ncbi:hypothetical protein PHET_11072 [Paragonimus heterotremus]|uniref:EKC/KEOPS complex subunit CGI121 n=1 Tax=Paragonimus heterotremus TaxID=100268 RepID=A0A8J4SQP5_9TREM|nr:hypothetical protein PHET_11072 [Paragonimus heterotremus]
MSKQWQKHTLDLFPTHGLTIGYWLDVSNSNDLHKMILNKQLPVPRSMTCIVIDAKYIIDVMQIETAVTQALLHISSHSMVTRELATEVLYCLSPTRSLNQALRFFSANSSTKRVLVVMIYPKNEPDTSSALDRCQSEFEHIVCGRIAHEDLINLKEGIVDAAELYGISSEELTIINQSYCPHSELVDAILTRMSARELSRV